MKNIIDSALENSETFRWPMSVKIARMIRINPSDLTWWSELPWIRFSTTLDDWQRWRYDGHHTNSAPTNDCDISRFRSACDELSNGLSKWDVVWVWSWMRRWGKILPSFLLDWSELHHLVERHDPICPSQDNSDQLDDALTSVPNTLLYYMVFEWSFRG